MAAEDSELKGLLEISREEAVAAAVSKGWSADLVESLALHAANGTLGKQKDFVDYVGLGPPVFKGRDYPALAAFTLNVRLSTKDVGFRVTGAGSDYATGEGLDAAFPFNLKAEKAIRQVNLKHIVAVHRAHRDYTDTLLARLQKAHWDNAAASNVLLADLCLGASWLDLWRDSGTLDFTPSGAVLVMKKVSDHLKTVRYEGFDWLLYVDSALVSGYRLYPYPGFDLLGEAELLANPVSKLAELKPGQFAAMTKSMFLLPQEIQEPPTFRDYFYSLKWATSGGAPGYKMESELYGVSVKWKARKNQIPFIGDLDALYQRCLVSKSQRNVVFIKPEAGKLRLAVSADLEGYICTAWILLLANGFYANWGGSTAVESVVQLVERMEEMVQYDTVLPWDWSGFDHQALLVLLKLACQNYISVARYNATHDLIAFEQLAAHLMLSWDDNEMTVWDQGIRHVYRVTAGLQSGRVDTSYQGLALNTGISKLAYQWACVVAGVRRVSKKFKGDDTVWASNWAFLFLIRIGYDVYGAMSAAGKFSIRNDFYDFLRVAFLGSPVKSARGYPTRVIPTITQRKPWTDGPSDRCEIIRNVYQAFLRIERRGSAPEIREVRDAIVLRLAASFRLSHAAFSHTLLGGKGLADALTRPRTPAPKYVRPSVRTKTTGRVGKIRTEQLSEQFAVQLPASLAPELEERELASVISDGEVRKLVVSSVMDYREALAQWYPPVAAVPPYVVAHDFSVYLRTMEPTSAAYRAALAYAHSFAPSFGSLVAYLGTYQDLQKLPEDTRRAVLANNYPFLNFPNVNGLSRGFVADWYFGSVPTLMHRIHPTMTQLVSYFVAASLGSPAQHKKRYVPLALQLFLAYADALFLSPFHRRFFCW